ncbi:MAG: helix-turn-helix domain-containing protein [Candidatus Erginobacter occultus]|nr:helix-turn-helix domain-containing protein [Candidatus Erginobacter occultus]
MSEPQNIEDVIAKYGAQKLTELILETLGPELTEKFNAVGLDPEGIIRYMPLGQKISKTRERKRMSVKEASAALKIPQYRIKAIEEGSFSQIDPEFFQIYARFLEIEDYVESWFGVNAELAEKMGISDREKIRPKLR